MRFSGTEEYVSTEDLTLAVNAAITLQRPLLLKNEPYVHLFERLVFMTRAKNA